MTAHKFVNLADLKNTTRAADAAPVEFAKGVHGIVQESQVDVLLMLAPEEFLGQPQQDRALIRVKVWSKAKPGLFSFTDIRCKGKSQAEMSRAIEFAAPALGERQEILYGDKHELSRLSNKARDHYISLCKELTKK